VSTLAWLARWVVLIVADVEPDLRRIIYQFGLLPWFAVASLVLALILVYWKFRIAGECWAALCWFGSSPVVKSANTSVAGPDGDWVGTRAGTSLQQTLGTWAKAVMRR
jgi:hypothetical protein